VAAPDTGAVGDSAGAGRAPTEIAEFIEIRAPAGTEARPVVTGAGGAEVGAAPSGDSADSGGGGIPGARVNLGPAPSPPTLARPTTARPEAAPSGDSVPSESLGEVDVPAPGVARVSVIN
jgi:hypothetical protein